MNKKRARGARRGVERRERMKRGSGMKGQDERSRGMEILIDEALAKIKPTQPLRLGKQAARRKRN